MNDYNLDPYNFEKIGMELKRLRTEHSYTQEQIAGDLGCTVSFVSNIENNRAKLNLRVLMYYARLCNVTIDSILNAGQNEDRQQDFRDPGCRGPQYPAPVPAGQAGADHQSSEIYQRNGSRKYKS